MVGGVGPSFGGFVTGSDVVGGVGPSDGANAIGAIVVGGVGPSFGGNDMVVGENDPVAKGANVMSANGTAVGAFVGAVGAVGGGGGPLVH